MKRQQRPTRWGHAFATSLAIAGLAVFGLATPALADGGDEPVPTPVIGPNISPNTVGSLTVHKYESPAEDPELPNNGTLIDPPPAGLSPIAGVTFTVTPILGVDLLTNGGWVTAAAYAANPSSIPAASLDAANARTDITIGDGTATFNCLPLGAYLVSETAWAGTGVVVPAKPFVITIPLPTTVDEESVRITDVHVYPKNIKSVVTKTVDDSEAFSVGDRVSWTVSAEIPTTYGAEEITSFSILDTLDPRLRYVSGTVVASLTAADPADPAYDLTPGTTLTVTHTPLVGEAGGGELSLLLAGAAYAQLAGYADGQFTVTFETEVIGVGSGTILNTPLANINDNDYSGTPVNTQWGFAEIFKFDGETEVGLEGAVFQVFTTQTGGDPLEFTVFVDDPDNPGETIETTVTDFETDENGHVTIPGLRIGGTYWIEETEAPVRYQQLTERIQIVGLTAGETQPVIINVPNIEVPDWELPLTGGSGLIIPAMGIALIATAAGTASLFARKKRSI